MTTKIGPYINWWDRDCSFADTYPDMRI